jgi:hypothetical protein
MKLKCQCIAPKWGTAEIPRRDYVVITATDREQIVWFHCGKCAGVTRSEVWAAGAPVRVSVTA